MYCLGSPLFVKFVDFNKAFDSLERKKLWRMLVHFGIPGICTEEVYAVRVSAFWFHVFW